jgi:hypothetical protein
MNALALQRTSKSFIPLSGTHIQAVIDIASFFDFNILLWKFSFLWNFTFFLSLLHQVQYPTCWRQSLEVRPHVPDMLSGTQNQEKPQTSWTSGTVPVPQVPVLLDLPSCRSSMVCKRSLFLRVFVCVVVFLGCLLNSFADETYYVDSVAANSASTETNLLNPPVVRNKIVTSGIFDAGTIDNVYITYVGDFSSSGPHVLHGDFRQGAVTEVFVPLARKIGDLVKVVLQMNGTDYWLPSEMQCEILPVNYELLVPRIWIGAWSVENELLFNNAHSPGAQIDIPTSMHVDLKVQRQYLVFQNTGLDS